MTKCDALILGGGIGGASIAYRLSKQHDLKVMCLEKEAAPGYHATGRAFGIFTESNVRSIQGKLLTYASRPFLENPDEECVDEYIRDNFKDGALQKTGLLAVSSTKSFPFLHEAFGPSEQLAFTNNIEWVPQHRVTDMAPFLNADQLAPHALYEPAAANFDTGCVSISHF